MQPLFNMIIVIILHSLDTLFYGENQLRLDAKQAFHLPWQWIFFSLRFLFYNKCTISLNHLINSYEFTKRQSVTFLCSIMLWLIIYSLLYELNHNKRHGFDERKNSLFFFEAVNMTLIFLLIKPLNKVAFPLSIRLCCVKIYVFAALANKW